MGVFMAYYTINLGRGIKIVAQTDYHVPSGDEKPWKPKGYCVIEGDYLRGRVCPYGKGG